MRTRPTVAVVLVALGLVACMEGREAAERAVAALPPSGPAEVPGQGGDGAQPSPVPMVSEYPSQPVPGGGGGPGGLPPDDGRPCDQGDAGGTFDMAARGLPEGDAVVEASVARTARRGCGWVLTLKNLDVAWQVDEIVYPDDVKNPAVVPPLPESLKVRERGQAIGGLGTPSPVVAWLFYEDYSGRWRAEYVMHGDTLRPLPTEPDSIIANNHLRFLYREDEDTRAERIAAQVERLRELHATQRANATNQKRPPTPRLDYLRSRTGR